MNELKVGFLTLIAIACMGGISLKLTGGQASFGERVEYKSYFKDASGIFTKTPIKIAGINAGQIKSIELDGHNALVRFEIDEKITLQKDAQLKVKTVGFLGDKYIELTLGQSPEKVLAGGFVSVGSTAGIENLASDASQIMVEVKEIVKSIKESLEDENRENALKKIISNIHEVSENAKSITESIKKITTGNDSSLNKIVDSLEDMSAQLAYETDRNAKGSVMEQFNRLKPLLDNANKAVADIRIIVADVKAGKGTIGKLLRDEEVIDQVSETLSSVNQLVNRVSNIESDISLFTGFNTDNGNHTQFDVDIYPAPEKFFRLGFAKNDFGPDGAVNTTTTSTISGTSTITDKRVVESGKIKFNLQIGRVLQRVGIRAGLIESTGGLGVDYYLHDYGSRVSMEFFDYQEDVGINMRLVLEMRMMNVFYARVTGEDLLSDSSNQTATISAGLRFSDSDLTSLIGLVVQ